MPKITVAICTGRDTEDTHYDKWMEVRTAFLNRKLRSKHLNGEFGTLLAACLGEKLNYHIEYQIKALELGTRQPDRIIIVDRCRDDIDGMQYFDSEGKSVLIEPMIAPRELELSPRAAMCCSVGRRTNKTSFGCNDKNTAIVLCETEYLLMLDDCCLPGFGLVQAAFEACEAGCILLPGHQQMYIEESVLATKTWEAAKIEIAQANWAVKDREILTVEQAVERRRVFGIWAMDIRHILAVNGFNFELDGDRGGLDEELMERVDRYARATDVNYMMHENARVYEIGHTHPWGTTHNREDWHEYLPPGWNFKAIGPGRPSLRAIRKDLGIKVGTDIFNLAEHADVTERDEVIDELIDELAEFPDGDKDE